MRKVLWILLGVGLLVCVAGYGGYRVFEQRLIQMELRADLHASGGFIQTVQHSGLKNTHIQAIVSQEETFMKQLQEAARQSSTLTQYQRKKEILLTNKPPLPR